MRNISINNEPIQLNRGSEYFIIDAEYLNDIKLNVKSIDLTDLSNQLREKVFAFPYTNTPFAEYVSKNDLFYVNQIIKANIDENNVDFSCFSADTGLLFFIEKDILVSFVYKYDYYDLVDSESDIINYNYWDNITTGYSLGSIGLIVSQGINSDVDFDGSGTFKIVGKDSVGW